MSTSEFNIKEFRPALGQFPTGVTVITTVDKNGDPIGMTASSFNSLSMDPPLILWSVDKGAHSAPIFDDSEHFCVNVLSKEQVAISNRFAGRGEDKFKDVEYTTGVGGSPLLPGCAAQFQCNTWKVYEGGDHLIVVGEVVGFFHDKTRQPLVFAQGSYAVSAQHPESVKRNHTNAKPTDFLADYLPFLLHSAFTASGSELYPQLMEKHSVTPEEWRIFTLLSNSELSNAEALADMLMQPVNILNDTIKLMSDKGDLSSDAEGNLSLTEQGQVLSQQLFAVAKEHETLNLAALTAQQAADLKEGLKILTGNN